MSNAIFPVLPGLDWSVTKTPIWSNKVQTSASGKETRTAFFSYPIWLFKLKYNILRADAVNQELQKLAGFFNARSGSFDDFLYTDPTDNTVTGGNIGTGDGTTVAFQLVRHLDTFSEPIKNINGTPTIYVNGVAQATTAYSISAAGLVTFNAAPANGAAITADFQFYFRVRFDQDQTEFANFMYQLWSLNQLTLRSIKT